MLRERLIVCCVFFSSFASVSLRPVNDEKNSDTRKLHHSSIKVKCISGRETFRLRFRKTMSTTTIKWNECNRVPVRLAMSKLLRTKQVLECLGIGRTTLFTWVRSGTFPRPIKPHGNARVCYWDQGQLDQWRANLAQPVSKSVTTTSQSP